MVEQRIDGGVVVREGRVELATEDFTEISTEPHGCGGVESIEFERESGVDFIGLHAEQLREVSDHPLSKISTGDVRHSCDACCGLRVERVSEE